MTPDTGTSQHRGSASEPDRVRKVAMPSAARAISTLSHVDYEDAFVIELGRVQDRTAEQWARAVLEDTSTAMRRLLASAWFALRLDLGPTPSDHFVLGLEIQSRTPDCVLLAVSSRFRMRGELLFERQPQTLFYATFVQQDDRVARAVWAAGAPVHRWAVRYLMEQVSRRTDAGPKHKT
jgi:hypothetical protein